MVVQVWLTVLLIAAIILGSVWALVYRPFMQRWQAETRREQEERRVAEEQKKFREKAILEIDRDCAVDIPDKDQEVQEINKQ